MRLGRMVRTTPIAPTNSVVISNDNKYVAVAGNSKTIEMFDIETKAEVLKLENVHQGTKLEIIICNNIFQTISLPLRCRKTASISFQAHGTDPLKCSIHRLNRKFGVCPKPTKVITLVCSCVSSLYR